MEITFKYTVPDNWKDMEVTELHKHSLEISNEFMRNHLTHRVSEGESAKGGGKNTSAFFLSMIGAGIVVQSSSATACLFSPDDLEAAIDHADEGLAIIHKASIHNAREIIKRRFGVQQ